MPIQSEILLRYRGPGHVRFQLPSRLCTGELVKRLLPALTQVEGVYQVRIHPKQRKLSIRYREEICPFLTLAKQLHTAIAGIEHAIPRPAAGKTAAATPAGISWLRTKLNTWKTTQWAKSKYQEGKETAQALRILSKRRAKIGAALLNDPEKAIIDFCNDILVLYLIKTHWPLITQQWLAKPFKHRYEWLSVFYMMYLLMRSRMPKK